MLVGDEGVGSRATIPEAWADQCQSLVAALTLQGWAVWEDFLPAATLAELRTEVAALAADQEATMAGRVGSSQDARGIQLANHIRNTRIKWLEPAAASAAQRQYIGALTALMAYLNRALFLAMNSWEGHYAFYPPGGFYKKHLDRFQNSSSRQLSTVLYLNNHWQAGDGGELVIYNEQDPTKADSRIAPVMGRLVVFLSGSIYHEVLKARRPRFALAAWLRQDPVTTEPAGDPSSLSALGDDFEVPGHLIADASELLR